MKEEYKFVRYGALKSKKQKGFNSYDNESRYHSPPQGKGFYAFPYGYEEIFLVAGLPYQGKKQNLQTITKHEKWISTDEVEDFSYETKNIWAKKNFFTLKKDDLLWHHLSDKIHDKKLIFKTHGEWCLTTVETWKRAFMKEVLSNRRYTVVNFSPKTRQSKNGIISKDNLEVFVISKKI